MNGEAQILHPIVPEDISFTCRHKDAITAKLDAVFFDNGAGRIPYLDTITTFIYAQVLSSGYPVGADQRVFRARDINSD